MSFQSSMLEMLIICDIVPSHVTMQAVMSEEQYIEGRILYAKPDRDCSEDG